MKFLIVFFFYISLSLPSAKSQVLISLLLGDKLNSGKIEFGLDGGFNFSNMSDSEGNWEKGLNLGFYFYFKMTDNSWIHTGVLVKSPFGVRNLYPYPTGDEDVDSLMLNDGEINRNLRYFNVPVTYCHYIYKPFFLEGGVMLGLRNKAWDEFVSTSTVGDDIIVERDIRDQVKALDAGLLAGTGYKFQKGLGISLGARYYYGLVNAHTDIEGIKHKNSNLYLFITVPIGKGRAEKRQLEKEQEINNN
jgi:hypothetical protein